MMARRARKDSQSLLRLAIHSFGATFAFCVAAAAEPASAVFHLAF